MDCQGGKIFLYPLRFNTGGLQIKLQQISKRKDIQYVRVSRKLLFKKAVRIQSLYSILVGEEKVGRKDTNGKTNNFQERQTGHLENRWEIGQFCDCLGDFFYQC